MFKVRLSQLVNKVGFVSESGTICNFVRGDPVYPCRRIIWGGASFVQYWCFSVDITIEGRAMYEFSKLWTSGFSIDAVLWLLASLESQLDTYHWYIQELSYLYLMSLFLADGLWAEVRTQQALLARVLEQGIPLITWFLIGVSFCSWGTESLQVLKARRKTKRERKRSLYPPSRCVSQTSRG